MKKAFTLIELIIVVVVIGILAIIAYPIYITAKERALDKEAIANLKLIQKAEGFFKMDNAAYYPTTGGSDACITTIDQNLKLDIPKGTGRSWNYTVTNSSSTGANTTRSNDPNSRSWKFNYTSTDEPTCVNGTGAGIKCPY